MRNAQCAPEWRWRHPWRWRKRVPAPEPLPFSVREELQRGRNIRVPGCWVALRGRLFRSGHLAGPVIPGHSAAILDAMKWTHICNTMKACGGRSETGCVIVTATGSKQPPAEFATGVGGGECSCVLFIRPGSPWCVKCLAAGLFWPVLSWGYPCHLVQPLKLIHILPSLVDERRGPT